MSLYNLRELSLSELVEKLLEYNIGEHGRLIYLKNYLKKDEPVYESDKRFLQICLRKLEEIEDETIMTENSEINQDEQNLKIINKLQELEIGNTNRLSSIKQHLLESKAISDPDRQYLREKYSQLSKIDDNEKTISEAINTITKLKQLEIGNFDRLESIKEKLETQAPLSISDIKYFNTKAQDLKKLQLEQNSIQEKQISEHEIKSKIKTSTKVETDYGSSFTITLKISHILLVSAIIVCGLWLFGLFLIDLYPVQDHLLGLAIGLGIGTVAIYKINKKANRLFQH